MALFLTDEIYKCEKCGERLFEEVEVKSYITNGEKISENTSNKAIKCVNCGHYHNISDDYDLVEQA